MLQSVADTHYHIYRESGNHSDRYTFIQISIIGSERINEKERSCF